MINFAIEFFKEMIQISIMGLIWIVITVISLFILVGGSCLFFEGMDKVFHLLGGASSISL